MKKIVFACLVSAACSFTLFADSPVTSTVFYSSYLEYEIVGYAEQSGIMDEKIAAYLLNADNLIDVKAAVINALGWDYYGKKNADVFLKFVAGHHEVAVDKINYSALTAPELMCIGYLRIMDDYNVTAEALEMLEMARQKMPESFTVNMVYAIVDAQQKFDADWCGVWMNTAELLKNNKLERDIKTAAIQSVVDYMILYKSSCSYIYSGE